MINVPKIHSLGTTSIIIHIDDTFYVITWRDITSFVKMPTCLSVETTHFQTQVHTNLFNLVSERNFNHLSKFIAWTLITPCIFWKRIRNVDGHLILSTFCVIFPFTSITWLAYCTALTSQRSLRTILSVLIRRILVQNYCSSVFTFPLYAPAAYLLLKCLSPLDIPERTFWNR